MPMANGGAVDKTRLHQDASYPPPLLDYQGGVLKKLALPGEEDLVASASADPRDADPTKPPCSTTWG